jgi:hypothetical protein
MNDESVRKEWFGDYGYKQLGVLANKFITYSSPTSLDLSNTLFVPKKNDVLGLS